MEVKAYYYNAGGMTQFRYPEAAYEGWVVLAPQSGRFSFAIYDGAAADGGGRTGASGGGAGAEWTGAGGAGAERTGAGGAGAERTGAGGAGVGEIGASAERTGAGGAGAERTGAGGAGVGEIGASAERSGAGGAGVGETGTSSERSGAGRAGAGEIGASAERSGTGRSGAGKASADETAADAYCGEAAFGELVLCPPGFVLKRSMLEPTAFHFVELSSLGGLELPPGKVRIRDVHRLGSTFDYLVRLRAEQASGYIEEVAHLIRDLLFLVRREQAYAAASRRETTEPLMHHAAALMERGACEPEFSLQRIAGQCGLRASQLSTRFQAAYGMSPIRFATSVRLAKAAKLLVETDLTLDDVAERCGYQNAFYFSRVFSKQMKISPSLFRRANRV
ncbi:helix-turn-helix domain-containing protein [Cohnella sp. GCM10012308]|uniref:helix-turn-helix domain-containing protein n=1 Tax=Cohnella sp. GCM10012308 TaxID=3317329 RepID=UPI0036232008